MHGLTGTIPATLGLLTELTGLDLRGNSFTGHVPDALAQLTQLQGLWLNHNDHLTGTIPTSLCELTSWTVGIWVDCELIECACDVCECA